MFYADNPMLHIVEPEAVIPRFIGTVAPQEVQGEARMRLLALRPRLQSCNTLGSGGLYSLPSRPTRAGGSELLARAWRMHSDGLLEDNPTDLTSQQAMMEWLTTWQLSLRDPEPTRVEAQKDGWVGTLLRHPAMESRLWLLRQWGIFRQTVMIEEHFDGAQQAWKVTWADLYEKVVQFASSLHDAFVLAGRLIQERLQAEPSVKQSSLRTHNQPETCDSCRRREAQRSPAPGRIGSAHQTPEPLLMSCSAPDVDLPKLGYSTAPIEAHTLSHETQDSIDRRLFGAFEDRLRQLAPPLAPKQRRGRY